MQILTKKPTRLRPRIQDQIAALISAPNDSMGNKSTCKARIRSVGQMALTNYITQTIIGITVFAALFEKSEMSRTGVWLFIVCVWAVQILWSKAWLTRFRFGPIEWMWRCATYRSRQPLLRSTAKN